MYSENSVRENVRERKSQDSGPISPISGLRNKGEKDVFTVLNTLVNQ